MTNKNPKRTLFTNLSDLAVSPELGSYGAAVGAERLCDLLHGFADLFSDGYRGDEVEWVVRERKRQVAHSCLRTLG